VADRSFFWYLSREQYIGAWIVCPLFGACQALHGLKDLYIILHPFCVHQKHFKLAEIKVRTRRGVWNQMSSLTVEVRIPSALRSHTGGTTQISVEASTVAQALRGLEERFPALIPFLRDTASQLRPTVSIYVNDEHVRYLRGEQIFLQNGDTVLVVPVIMGG
jgi:molybdopterin synthase sulfur carrier subunit